MKHLLFLGCLVFMLPLQAQPLSLNAQEQLVAPENLALTLPAEQKPQLSNKKQSTFKPQPLQVARTVLIQQPLTKLAPWQTLNNQAYSRLKITGQKAKHLSLGFENINLPASAKLYIIDANTQQILHEYSARDISKQSLWTPMLDTNSVVVELNMLDIDRAQASLELKQAGYGTMSMSGALQKSGSCNVDVACSEGDAWRDVIRSVARYTIQTEQGTFVCTGTLVNNDNLDQRPLFLTAAHCLVSESTANAISIYWNYETSVCGGSPDGNLSQVQTGVNYLSRSEGIGTESDFALVELRSRPPANYNVFYSGWNAVAQSAGNVVTIHHPAGDEKRISIDADPLTITAFNSEVIDETQDYYRIAAWDVGTTEGGSSGSGIWNTNKELIGTLSGGLASCTQPEAPDWYGRMSSHWQATSQPMQQLAYFLAQETASPTLAGLEPCDAPDIVVSLSVATPAINTQFNFDTQVTGGAAPYTYSWDFNSNNSEDSADANPTHVYTSADSHVAKLDVIDNNQCKSSAIITVIVPEPNERFAGAAQAPSGYIQTASAQGGWVATADFATEGAFSLRSEIINEDEVSAIQTTDAFQQGTLRFNYRVSSEIDFDFFKFYVDGVEQFSASGEVDWTQAEIAIAAGNRTLKWTYEKDESVSEGLDIAWIDDVTFEADTTQPPLSSDASLSDITLSTGALTPVFDAATTSYTVNVSNSVLALNITASANDSAASINVNGSSSDNDTISLAVGVTTVNIVVTAEDLSSQTYSVIITRASAPVPPPSVPSGGGGGSIALWLLLSLLGYSLLRVFNRD